jgi:hypothetical protein
MVEAIEAEELDADSLAVLENMDENVRWTNAMGDRYEGKLACARGVDELLQASQAYSVELEEIVDLGGDHV